MALTSGNTLSLNALAGATGFTQNSNVSLGAIEGSPTAGENISLSSMALGGSGTSIGSVGSISGYTYAVENTNETYTLGFTDAGTRFASKIGNRAENFTWSVPSGTTIGLTTNNGSSAVFTVSDRPNTNGIFLFNPNPSWNISSLKLTNKSAPNPLIIAGLKAPSSQSSLNA